MWPAVLVVACIIGIFTLSYTLNRHTPVPLEEGEIVDTAGCKACKNFACQYKQQIQKD